MFLVMLASGVNTAQAPQFQMGAADPELGDLKLPTKGFQLLESIKKKPKYKKIDGPTDLRDDEAKKSRYKCTTCDKVSIPIMQSRTENVVKFAEGTINELERLTDELGVNKLINS